MHSKPTAIVLAGTVPHIALIENLQRRGYYTILVDYYDHPPAKEAADRHIQESTLDKETVLEIASRERAKLVITTCMDHANVTASYVGEKLGLPIPYTHGTSLAVTNKGLMKQIMADNGIPTSRYAIGDNIAELMSAGLRFPVAIKPTDSNGSKGVMKARSKQEMNGFLEDAVRLSRTGQAIVEEYVEGREIGADCLVVDGQATVVMTRERRKLTAKGVGSAQQIQGSFWPADLTERSHSQVESIVGQIAGVFGLNNTPLILQAIDTGAGMSVIEFAARIGGGENFRIIERLTGLDIIDKAVDLYLGESVALNYRVPTSCVADIYLYARPCQFGSICGHEPLLANGTLDYLRAYKAEGDRIGPELSGNNRVGAFLVEAANRRQLLDRLRTALDCIEVFSKDGVAVFRRELYSQ